MFRIMFVASRKAISRKWTESPKMEDWVEVMPDFCHELTRRDAILGF